MTLTQMQYFDKVCTCGSYTKAAEKLFVSQPAISQAIKELENECNVSLFLRQGNKLKITSEGNVLWEEIKIALLQIRRINQMVSQFEYGRNYIKIGLSSVSGNAVFPKICKNYRMQYPDVQIDTHEDITPSLINLLDNGFLDFIITTPFNLISDDKFQKYYEYIPLPESPLLFYVNVNHQLASKKVVTLEEIVKEPLVLLNDHFSSTKRFKTLIKQYGLTLNVVHYTSQIFTIVRFIENNSACGFLPAYIQDNNKAIKGIPFSQRSTPLMLIWRKNCNSSNYSSVKNFIKLVKNIF